LCGIVDGRDGDDDVGVLAVRGASVMDEDEGGVVGGASKRGREMS